MSIPSAALTLFLIMDPVGNLPLFASALDRVEPRRRQWVVARELLIALLLMVLFLYSGQAILRVLHLRQETVSIAGGIVLFLISLRMIFPAANHRASPMDNGKTAEGEPFLVPLAVPLVAGPSVLALLLLMMNEDPTRHLDWLLALVVAWVGTSAILLSSGLFMRLLGRQGMIAVERLTGMLFVMIAVQMFLDGVAAYLKTPA